MALQCNKGLNRRIAMVVPVGCAYGAGVDSREWQTKYKLPVCPRANGGSGYK